MLAHAPLFIFNMTFYLTSYAIFQNFNAARTTCLRYSALVSKIFEQTSICYLINVYFVRLEISGHCHHSYVIEARRGGGRGVWIGADVVSLYVFSVMC